MKEVPIDEGVRIVVRVAYRGARYSGWQRQPNAPTVQATVETALSRLLGESTVVIGASRTDSGVHALAQHCHFTLPRPFPLKGLVLGGNTFLPQDIRLMAARVVPGTFHAQRSARWKRYLYRLSLVRTVDPLRSPYVAVMDGRVDLAKIQAAVSVFRGRHDFSAFAKSGGSHDDPVRRVFSSKVEERGQELVFEFCGEGFLRGMVRAMVGTLVEAGLARRQPSSIEKLLEPGGRRSEAGVAAPANGLVLAEIDYPQELLRGQVFEGDA